MAALDFPSSPTNGQTYTANGVTFVYDSSVGAWEGTISIGTASVTASETPPVSPSAGNLWFSTDEGSLYVYYDSFWVGISGTSIGTGATGAGGDQVFFENEQLVTTSYTISTDRNAMTAGPISIDAAATVTVPAGSVWSVV